ncbi:MAG: FAD-dependent oxidoreductase, partial [Bacteroidota bacterium]
MSYFSTKPTIPEIKEKIKKVKSKESSPSAKKAFSDFILKRYGESYREELKQQRAQKVSKKLLTKLEDPSDTTTTVGIIGGGFAGMYAGLILQSLGIECEIFEASERVGGRIDTWYSTNYDPNDKNKAGLYGEVGGMRIPQFSDDMFPVQQLALAINAVLRRNKLDEYLVKWRKFYYNSEVQRMRYNNMPAPIEAKNASLNALNFGVDKGGDIPMV